jgi:hypothetical protein
MNWQETESEIKSLAANATYKPDIATDDES